MQVSWIFSYASDTLPLLGNIIDFNWQNKFRWVVLGLSQDGAYTDLFENLSEK
jgi:hypothetical protein